jgi:hypothetical protein
MVNFSFFCSFIGLYCFGTWGRNMTKRCLGLEQKAVRYSLAFFRISVRDSNTKTLSRSFLICLPFTIWLAEHYVAIKFAWHVLNCILSDNIILYSDAQKNKLIPPPCNGCYSCAVSIRDER